MSKVTGYVARDENDTLWFHFRRPRRTIDVWESTDDNFYIPEEYFPDFIGLEWKDKPVKVEISIEKI